MGWRIFTRQIVPYFDASCCLCGENVKDRWCLQPVVREPKAGQTWRGTIKYFNDDYGSKDSLLCFSCVYDATIGKPFEPPD